VTDLERLALRVRRDLACQLLERNAIDGIDALIQIVWPGDEFREASLVARDQLGDAPDQLALEVDAACCGQGCSRCLRERAA
jgi:hypothetical protein